MNENCFYDRDKEGKHQCPVCKKWYCDECREMFLPLDSMFLVRTAEICPQCHFAKSSYAREQDTKV